ncbi:MAG: LpxD N-terminal domain-containing protein, partial [Gemmatimonadales bacterium]
MSTSITVGQLAEHLGAELTGDPSGRLVGAAPLEAANEGEVSFLARRKFLPYLGATRATAVLVTRSVGELDVVPPGTALLWVDDAYAALAEVLTLLYPEAPRAVAIAPTAVLEPGVELGADVSIGPHTVVESGAKLGDGARIGANCVIGERSELGAGTEIGNLVCVYPDTVIGADCIIHSGA